MLARVRVSARCKKSCPAVTGQLLHRENVHLLDIRRPVTRSFLSSLPFISEYELSDDNARCYHPLLHTYPTNQVGLENNHRVQVEPAGQVLKVQVQVLQDQVTNQDSNIMDSVQDMLADPYLCL